MKTPQIVIYVLLVSTIALVWTFGSPGEITIKVLQTVVIIAVGLMLAAATTIKRIK